MAQLNPYIIFSGNCREAMTFYQQCLGGDLFFHSIADSPMAEDCPSHEQKYILHSTLKSSNIHLSASDMGEHVKQSSVSLSLACNSKEEMERFFTNLSAGGNVTYALYTLSGYYGHTVGILTDKYGINWMFQLQAG